MVRLEAFLAELQTVELLNDKGSGKHLDETGYSLTKLPSCHFLGGTVENHIKKKSLSG
jgi:hypothetical protein